ncbi:hypothetical protein CcaverHIS002_0108050 [Cutaneotrichosporon cavernicola]|nr:hypothetical protein CcaverHIS002_0108050 [Cutaneotrichosporon cavernicola]
MATEPPPNANLLSTHSRNLATPPPLPPRTPPVTLTSSDARLPAPVNNGHLPPSPNAEAAIIPLKTSSDSTPEGRNATTSQVDALESAPARLSTPPQNISSNLLDLPKMLPIPPRQSSRLSPPRRSSPLRDPPPLPPRQRSPILGQPTPVSKQQLDESSDALPPGQPTQSSNTDSPSTAHQDKGDPLRSNLSAKEIHTKAVHHVEASEPSLTILGITPLMWAGLAIFFLLGIKLLGWHKFSLIAACGLAPVAALWLLPLPSFSHNEPSLPPQPADNVGWINHTLRTLFPLVSTDVLTPFVDLLEDALVQQVPPIVTSVRCTDVSLGREPIQLTSLRTITDDEWFASIAQGAAATGKGHSGTRSNALPSTLAKGGETGGETTQASDLSDFGPETASDTSGAWRRTHVRTVSGASNRSNKATKSIGPLGTKGSAEAKPVRPLSVSSQFSLGKETAKLRKRDNIVRRLRRGRHRHDEGLDEFDECVDEELNFDELQKGGAKGFYVNYEVSFTYRSTREMSKTGTGLHMLAYFGWGVKGLGGSEIPVFIDVLQLNGTLRLRLLLSPSPPFAREAQFTFVKMPEFDISARPLRNFGFGSVNAMDIPLLKTYVQKSIAQVAGSFVSPRHFHLDVNRLLLGKDAAMRTKAVGVLYLMIHGCDDLPRTDTLGSCDPYVAVSFSKFDKPLFSTRTIVNTLDPVFEEPAFLLVSSESIEVGEQLLLKVWDSDRFSMDDSIGQVKVDIAEIIELSERTNHGYELFRRHDDLMPEQPGMRAQGQIDWSVRFFPLWQVPVSEFHRRLEAIRDRRGDDDKTVAPWWLKWLDDWIEKPEWELERAKRRKEMVDNFTGERERDEIEAAMPPTDEFPSGVLQFHVHQCAELEMYPDAGTFSGSNISRRKSPASGKPALSDVIDRAPGENPEPPSAYAEVHLNDKYVFRTRTKRVNPQPYFNALSERFICDWREARIRFVVKDERDREHDPIIGIVSLRLRDVLSSCSQTTRWFPIVGGLGFGKLRISLLFKPVDIKLPRGLSSFDVCTFEMARLQTTDFEEALGKMPCMVIESEYDRVILQGPAEEAGYHEDDEGNGRPRSGTVTSVTAKRLSDRPFTMPRVQDAALGWDLPSPVRLAVQYRHSCSMVLSLVTRRRLQKNRVHALAVLSLTGVPDNEVTQRTVPVFATASVEDAMRANAAYVAHAALANAAPPNLPEYVQAIGFIKVEFALHPGVSRAHRKLGKRDLRFKAVYDGWEATRLLQHPHETEDGASESSDVELSADEVASGKESAEAMRNDDVRSLREGRSHVKALHKNNKGIFQLKIARTGKFVRDKVQARVLSTTGKTNLAQRPHGADVHVEEEGVSRVG